MNQQSPLTKEQISEIGEASSKPISVVFGVIYIFIFVLAVVASITVKIMHIDVSLGSIWLSWIVNQLLFMAIYALTILIVRSNVEMRLQEKQ